MAGTVPTKIEQDKAKADVSSENRGTVAPPGALGQAVTSSAALTSVRKANRPALWYTTRRGAAYCANTLDIITALPDRSVQLIVTSPPFALRTKKRYGNPPDDEYVEWFVKFAKEFHRVLKDNGSFVVEIGGAWNRGSPTRSIYQFKLLVELVDQLGFHLAEDFYWYNKAKLPSPAQWVTVERIRAKDAVTPIWWLSKTDKPKANNRNVLQPYTKSMEQLFKNGYNEGPRPSGHVVGKKFSVNHGGAIPPNLIQVANTRWADDYQNYCRENDLPTHPARFAPAIPEFFIKFLTDEGDLVLDPFAGSNLTGAVAEKLKRRWITFELFPQYVKGSMARFPKAALRASEELIASANEPLKPSAVTNGLSGSRGRP